MSDHDHDSVNHPSHYTGHPSGIECIVIVEHFGFCLGNTIKYIWRAGLKDDAKSLKASAIQDLKKARWYLDRQIATMEGKPEAPPRTKEIPLQQCVTCGAELLWFPWPLTTDNPGLKKGFHACMRCGFANYAEAEACGYPYAHHAPEMLR